MISITDIFKFIPESLKQTAVDTIVETVIERGEGLLSDSILNKIKGLRSDAAFRQQFETGLLGGLQRFIEEYQLQDEDLVAAISADATLFTQPEVQQALLRILQQPGQYLAEEQAVLAQSFSSVLPQRVNRDRVDQAIVYLLKCLAREVWHLPELQPIYSLEFQRITAESTHEQLAVQKAQLATLENLNIGVREALLQLTDALSDQKQLTSGKNSYASSILKPVVYHNLPQPGYSEFVGREGELKRIFDLLRPYPQSRHHLIVIDGIGGIGKSTLALEVAHRCLRASIQAIQPKRAEQDYLVRLRQILIGRFNEEELRTLCFDMALDYDMLPGQGKGGKARELIAYLERRNRVHEIIGLIQNVRPDIRDEDVFSKEISTAPAAEQFNAIIWTSAKHTVLTAEGIKTRYQNTSTLADIYRAIAIALERQDILRSPFEEQADIVRQVLTTQYVLLVIDNMETIDDERVLNFLEELPAPTKALITSRHRLGTAVAIRLSGMSWEEAQYLIRQESGKKKILLQESEARRLYERTGGLPLAMIWSIAQMGFGYDVESILSRLGNPTNNVTHFCFDGSIKIIKNLPAYKLLMACALFTNDSNREGLGYAAGISILDRDDGLVQLEKLSLIDKKSDRFSLLPLTRIFALARLAENPNFKKQTIRRWLDYLRKLCQEPNGEYYWRYRAHEFYKEGENILEAITWAYDYGNADDIFLLSRAAYDYLEVIGDWNRILSSCSEAFDLATTTNSYIDLARLANILGWIHYQQGNYDKALEYYQTALTCYHQINNKEGEAIAWQHFSSVYRKRGNFDKAKELNDRGWEIANNIDDGDLKALIEVNYGKLSRDSKDWQQAWKHFVNVRDYFEKRVTESPRDEPLARSVWGHLAIVAVHLNKPEQAKEYCIRSLEYFETRGTKAYMATLKYRLAIAELALSEYPDAQMHLEEALEWFDRLGMKPDYDEALKTQQELLKQIQDREG